MRIFKDRFNFQINIDDEYIEKLKNKMPPMGLDLIEDVLLHAESIKMSKGNKESRCYYKKCIKSGNERFYKVVVKYIAEKDEHWIVTGHLTDAIRESEDFNESSL